jgi:hypothetical protein
MVHALAVGSKRKKEPTGAPEDLIEITPEMLEAGAAEIMSADWRVEEAEDIAKSTFLAMLKLSASHVRNLSKRRNRRRHLP